MDKIHPEFKWVSPNTHHPQLPPTSTFQEDQPTKLQAMDKPPHTRPLNLPVDSAEAELNKPILQIPTEQLEQLLTVPLELAHTVQLPAHLDMEPSDQTSVKKLQAKLLPPPTKENQTLPDQELAVVDTHTKPKSIESFNDYLWSSIYFYHLSFL